MVDYTAASGYKTDGSGRRQYVDRNDANGVQGTYLIADDRNMDRNELVNAVRAAGMTLDGQNHEQLALAIQVLGNIHPWSKALSDAVGGYWLGALVVDGNGVYWTSTVGANKTVPGTTGAKWKSLFDGLPQLSGGNNLSGTQTVTNGNITSNTLNGSTAAGQLCWGGSAGGQILGRGTAGTNGPVGAYLYPIEVVGSFVGGRIQVQGYGQRADVDFRLLGSGAAVMLFGGNQVAYLTDVASAVSAEAKLRSNADTTLQTNITTEIARAEGVESTLQGNITAESTARAAADTALQSGKLSRGGDTTTGIYTATNWAAVSATTSTVNGVVGNWGGYLTSRITGRDVTTSIFSWENVGQDQGATIQIAGYGLDVRYTFPKSGRLSSPAGTMAVTADLPFSDPTIKAQVFTGKTGVNTLPTAFSSIIGINLTPILSGTPSDEWFIAGASANDGKSITIYGSTYNFYITVYGRY
ncbi:hypothetical protein OQ496_09175 [Acetobacter suratthaniensis]|uniref:Tail fiber protein n=1 Tax=Acetobacter suratthaniensis TaxID=1502841 RepID=A0ABS3LMA6_9PROT|nr:hypothetical protein [Acetobacter suratthaniensis]MBO1328500.1 hypothetical protein [Acetobacter suratthaniensis]MCX2566629.1 hypothetical protein [Acetobacter suratthaniensis]